MSKENITYGGNQIPFKPTKVSFSSNSTESFRKEIAFQTWGKIFEELGIRYNHKPRIYQRVKKFQTERSYSYEDKEIGKADFYIHNADVFVLIKDYSYDEECQKTSHSANHLARDTRCSVVTAYTDGKFRLTDYYVNSPKEYDDDEDENYDEPSEIPLSNDAALSRCPECDWFYFHTSNGWTGCRHCSHFNSEDSLAPQIATGITGLSLRHRPTNITYITRQDDGKVKTKKKRGFLS